MIEIPESITIANQLNQNIVGKIVKKVIANSSPHKFAWYHQDPNNYNNILANKRIQTVKAFGGHIEIIVEDARIVFTDGTNIRYYTDKTKLPTKHQLLIEFDDETYLVVSIQMYGGIWAFLDGEFKSKYYQVSKEKPSPLSSDFTKDYFLNLVKEVDNNLSVKAFLATDQRIPGLGNGVLQDILFNANLHPKRKMKTLSEDEIDTLYHSIISTLQQMTKQSGRDTEKDIFGNTGSYKTILSSKTNNTPCPVCNNLIKKEAYLGGSIYYCEKCQKL